MNYRVKKSGASKFVDFSTIDCSENKKIIWNDFSIL